jgi:hypothetical protein
MNGLLGENSEASKNIKVTVEGIKLTVLLGGDYHIVNLYPIFVANSEKDISIEPNLCLLIYLIMSSL